MGTLSQSLFIPIIYVRTKLRETVLICGKLIPIIYVRTKLRETVLICGKLIPKAAWLDSFCALSPSKDCHRFRNTE